jgi:hypothetical protein
VKIPDKQLGGITRIIAFLMGLAIASYLFLYSFHYEKFPHTITALGYNFTSAVVISVLVMMTIISGWLVKMGITGRTGF